MKKNLLLIAVALFSLPGSLGAQEKNDTVKFTVVRENPITSIKDQNQSGTCWA